MTKRTIRSGQTVFTNGTLLAGDTLNIQAASAPGGASGVAIVSTALTNAGTITVRGGDGGFGGPGTPGGVLDVLGVLTDQGALVIQGGPNYLPSGQGGRVEVSGTLSVTTGGTVKLQGGDYRGGGALLANTGLIDNEGVITAQGGSTISNDATLVNGGAISLKGGGTYYNSVANLIDAGVLTNSGSITVGGGAQGASFSPGSSGATLTVTGALTNTGSISLQGGEFGHTYYGIGHGGVLQAGGHLYNAGTIEVGAGRSNTYDPNGYGAKLIDSGFLINTGTIKVDGSSGFYPYLPGLPKAAAGATSVTGFLNSSGLILVGGGGGGTPTAYVAGQGGVLVDSGNVSISGSVAVAGGGASTDSRYPGGSGGTLSVTSAGYLTNTGQITVHGGDGAAIAGEATGGAGGVLAVAGGFGNFGGAITLQAGGAGQGGGNAGGGAQALISSTFFSDGNFTIAAGAGSAAATLTVASGGVLKCVNIASDIENGGVIILDAGATITGTLGFEGVFRNTGTIMSAGTGSALISQRTIVNDGLIDAGSGTLTLKGDKVTSDAAPGLFHVAAGGLLTITGASLDAAQSVSLDSIAATLSVTAGNAGVLVTSPAGGTVDVTGGGAATLNAADTNLSVFLLTAGSLTLSRMSAITAAGSSGADTITALSSGQTLTGGAGLDLLNGAAATGDLFRDTAAGLNGDTIGDFAGTDAIDITNIAAAGATLAYTQQGSHGLLAITNGSATTTITLQGSFTTSSFVTTSDQHGGVLITLHG